MTRKTRAVAGVLLLSILFCCSGAMAETYDFGGATGNGEYSGTLAVDNSGNVAFTMAAATGPGASVQTMQNSNAGGGASATQETRAVGDSAFVGSGAANAHGDTASTAAHAFGNAEIESVQGAIAGGSGAAAGQMTELTGQTAAAGSLGISGSGYEASTTTRITDGGVIDTMQGAAAGSFSYNTAGQANSNTFFTVAADQIFGTPLVLYVDVTGAVAGQYSEIYAENGGQASSSANGNGNFATTQASVTGEGSIGTIQIAGAGQIGVEGLLDGISADGAVAGQFSGLDSDNGGSVSSRATNSHGYEAGTAARYYGEGEIWGCYQGAAAGQIGIAGMASVDGAAAGQALQLESDTGGSVSSSATNSHGYVAGTGARYYGTGFIDTVQGAAAGQAGITGLGSVDGAIAGQDSAVWQAPLTVSSGQIGIGINPGDAPQSYAYTHASSGNGYDQVELETRFNEMSTSTGPVVGVPANNIVQCAGAGRISVTGIFDAQGAAGFQGTEFSGFGLDAPDDQVKPSYQIVTPSYRMTASAAHGSTHDETDYSEGYQWAVAGMLTDGDDTIQGAAVGPHDPSV
ncbi:MAG TPA: hypothetical protein PKX98_07615 [Methanoregulaceae archaeon]|nr:hypothetical protein [Methanoregulaceae archaeon]